MLVLIQAANPAKVSRQIASCGPRHQTIMSCCAGVRCYPQSQLSFDVQLHRIPGRLTSCFCRPAMVFAAPALALSFSVRSKDPNGSATDAGTFTATGCKSTIVFARYVNSESPAMTHEQQRSAGRLDLCIAPRCCLSVSTAGLHRLSVLKRKQNTCSGICCTPRCCPAAWTAALPGCVTCRRPDPPKTRPPPAPRRTSASAPGC